jgi:hypothetical protein
MKQFLFISFLLMTCSPYVVFSQEESNSVRNISYNDILTEFKTTLGKISCIAKFSIIPLTMHHFHGKMIG